MINIKPVVFRSLFISGLLRVRESFYSINYHHIPAYQKKQALKYILYFLLTAMVSYPQIMTAQNWHISQIRAGVKHDKGGHTLWKTVWLL